MKHLKRFALILILIAAAVCMSSCRQSDSTIYTEKEQIAEALLLQHRYAEAAEEMEALGSNEKAVTYARYCRGLEAGERGAFNTAAEIFRSLGNYRDSSKMAVYYLARINQAAAEEGVPDSVTEYLTAAKRYERTPSFRDSTERAESCYQAVYQTALELAEQKEYESAEDIFLRLENYLDSGKLAQKAKADALYETGDAAAAVEIYNTLDTEYQTYAADYEGKYTTALELKEQYRYDEAKEILAGLGAYKDSAGQIRECEYLKAAELLENKAYEEAVVLFRELEDYKNSAAMVLECSYRKAMDLIGLREYDKAEEILAGMNYYKDCKDQLERIKADKLFDSGDLAGAWLIYEGLGENCRTHQADYEAAFTAAEEKREAGDWDEARRLYTALGTYREADRMAAQCLYLKAAAYEEEHLYTEALRLYQTLEDPEAADACRYRYGCFLLENEQYVHAAKQFSLCPEYLDSSEMYDRAGRLAFEAGKSEDALEILKKRTDREENLELIYEIAAKASEERNYELAIAACDAAGDFREARTERMKYYRLWGELLFEQGNYDKYIEVISATGESEETAEKISMARQAKAKSLMEAGAWGEAATLLRALDGYGQSEALLKDCQYEIAAQMYGQGKYAEALAVMAENQLTGYREADGIMTGCRYQLGLEAEIEKAYEEAAGLFEACGNYKDSKEHLLNCRYLQGTALMEAKEYAGAAAWFILAGKHPDAAGQLDGIAEALDEAGETEKAETLRQTSFRIRAENALDRNAYRDAVSFYSHVTDPAIPKDREPEAFFGFGTELLSAGEYEKAAEMFAAAGDYPGAEENYRTARSEEGNAALKAQDFEKARACFEETGEDGKITESWNMEGGARLAEGRFAEAKAAFRKAGNQRRYEDAVLEEAKSLISAEAYGQAYELLKEIRNRADAQRLIHSEQAFVPFRISQGDTIALGSYEQDNNEANGRERIRWTVLTVKDNRALLISQYGLDCRPYNQIKALVTWETCTLRAWLNKDFFETAFSAEEQTWILTKEVDNSSRQGNSAWGISGGENTKDKVYLLSYREAETVLTDAADRTCIPTAHAVARGAYTKKDENGGVQPRCWWWLRSPGSSQTRAARVGTNGSRSENDVKQDNVCIRPVIWLDLTLFNY